MSSDSVLSGFYAVSYNLSICSWSHISFYGETSSVNIPSHILTPMVTMAKSFSSPCLQACTAASCRQQPHIEGQALPTGNVPSWAHERMTDVATHFFTVIVDHRLMAAYVPELWPLGSTWSLQKTVQVDPTQLGRFHHHSPGGRCSLKRNFSLLVKDPQYKVSAGEAFWNNSEDKEFYSCINEELGRNKGTQSTAEFFKVDKAILVLIDQAEDPERERARGRAERPGLQEGEE